MPALARDILRAAVARLGAAGVASPARDARLCLAAVLGIADDRLTLHLDDAVGAGAAAAFARMIAAREARQPVAQILGKRLFWGRYFLVTGDVLDPRPETETLIAAALARPFDAVLDLGTGSGCILLTLLAERPGARGVGVDISGPALAVARANAAALGLEGRVRLVEGNWATGLAGRFDLIVSNPPYIPLSEMSALAPEVRDWEPALALTPGADGLAAYRLIAEAAPRLLAPGGALLVEHGAGQGDGVAAILSDSGARQVQTHADMDGRARVVSAHWA